MPWFRQPADLVRLRRSRRSAFRRRGRRCALDDRRRDAAVRIAASVKSSAGRSPRARPGSSGACRPGVEMRGDARLAALSRSRAARSLTMRAVDLRHAGRRRALARAERERHADASGRIRRRCVSEFSNIASVSVGKPAMMSAPKTMSGRSRADVLAEADRHRRADAAASCASGSCRRPTAATGADAASAASRSRSPRSASSSASMESIEESRSRCRSGTWPQDRRDQPAEARRARQVGAVAGEVDAGQHHFAVAVVDEALRPARPPRPSAPSANCRGHRG